MPDMRKQDCMHGGFARKTGWYSQRQAPQRRLVRRISANQSTFLPPEAKPKDQGAKTLPASKDAKASYPSLGPLKTNVHHIRHSTPDESSPTYQPGFLKSSPSNPL
eukprot:1161517-Pelagomonas_calceolata.AAC.14